MNVNLTLNIEKVESLRKHLGDERVVTIGEQDSNGYIRVVFEVNNSMDVLNVIHAGQDHGLAMGLGVYSPKQKVSVTVA